MALLKKEYIADDVLFGLWEIQEDYNTLISMVHLNDAEHGCLESFMWHDRKLEWLSVRALLKELNGPGSWIHYNGNRKPHLHDKSKNISIAHSGNYTSMLLSETKKLGIDLEFMSHRISRIAHKFMNDNEYITQDEKDQKLHLYIHWCAKEALYKICDKQDISFKQNLTIEPFEPASNGILIGHVDNQHHDDDKFVIHYSVNENYVLAWTCK
jgi:hypothetical protein